MIIKSHILAHGIDFPNKLNQSPIGELGFSTA